MTTTVPKEGGVVVVWCVRMPTPSSQARRESRAADALI